MYRLPLEFSSVSRIVLLVVRVIWMSRSVAPGSHEVYAHGTGLFVGGLFLVVLFMGLWSRVLARQVRGDNLHRSLRKFHNAMFTARMLIPIWFGVAVFCLGWAQTVEKMLGPTRHWPIELPGMILGTLPALAAWMALWWAQY